MQIIFVNKFMLPGRYEKNENKKIKQDLFKSNANLTWNECWEIDCPIDWNIFVDAIWLSLLYIRYMSIYFDVSMFLFNFEKLFDDSSRQAICSSENEISNFLFVSFGRMTAVIKLQFKLQWSFEK